MAWYRCGGGATGSDSTLWLLDPVINASMLQQTYTGGAFVNALHKVRENQSNGIANLFTTVSFGGTTEPVINRIGNNLGGLVITTKIPGGLYKTLHFECMVTQLLDTKWRNATIQILPSVNIGSYGQADNPIKSVILADVVWTVEQINGQTGVVINSTANNTLSAQTVEVDVSTISSDFYVGFYNCDLSVYVRSVYLTVD